MMSIAANKDLVTANAMDIEGNQDLIDDNKDAV